MLPKNKAAVLAQLGPGQKLPEFDIKIEVSRLSVGVKGNPPFLSESMPSKCVADDSYWMIADDELHIQLTKMKVGETWKSALLGHE